MPSSPRNSCDKALRIRLSPRVTLYEAGQPPGDTTPGGLALLHVRDQAFGDGSHPTTRLCAGAVDLLCRQLSKTRLETNLKAGQPTAQSFSFLDVGTGTGVLARIARARGATFVVGTDIDPEALASASRHSELDSHSVPILISDELPDRWGARFDLVVANILEAPLRSLAKSLSKALAPEGQLLISGFTRAQVPSLRLTFEETGLRFLTESELDGWVLLAFRSKNS